MKHKWFGVFLVLVGFGLGSVLTHTATALTREEQEMANHIADLEKRVSSLESVLKVSSGGVTLQSSGSLTIQASANLTAKGAQIALNGGPISLNGGRPVAHAGDPVVCGNSSGTILPVSGSSVTSN